MLTSNERKSELAFRLMLVHSQNNEVPEGDMEEQVIDLMRNLSHMVKDYNIDLSECLEKGSEMHQADLEK